MVSTAAIMKMTISSKYDEQSKHSSKMPVTAVQIDIHKHVVVG